MTILTLLALQAAVLACAWAYTRIWGRTITFRVFNVRVEMYRV